MRVMVMLIAVPLLASCHGSEQAAKCPEPKCPIGTVGEFMGYGNSYGNTQAGGSGRIALVDGKEVQLGVGVSSGGEGMCRYICRTAQPCPAGTAPEITVERFSCKPYGVNDTGKQTSPQPQQGGSGSGSGSPGETPAHGNSGSGSRRDPPRTGIADSAGSNRGNSGQRADAITRKDGPPASPCPGCMFRNAAGNCVDPEPCAGKCFVRSDAPNCVCRLATCAGANLLNVNDCACHDRCEGAMRNCADVANCMDHNDHNSCNGRKHWSQDNNCWQDKPDC
jgi:hypothetical protein